jgi:hypothetical protein
LVSTFTPAAKLLLYNLNSFPSKVLAWKKNKNAAAKMTVARKEHASVAAVVNVDATKENQRSC